MSHLNVNGVDKPLDHVYVKARTENLFDINTTWNPPAGQTATVTVLGESVTITGKYYAYVAIPVTANETYTAKYSGTGDRVYVVAYRDMPFNTANMITGLSTSGTTINVGDTDTLYILFYSGDGTQGTTTYSDIMLNLGSTALPYEPYLITKEAWEARTRVILHGLTNPLCGISTYKDTLDLSTGALTRYVKKLVLDGTEPSWAEGSASLLVLTLSDVLNGSGITSCLCSHYNAVPNIEGGYSSLSGGCCSVRYNQLQIWFRDLSVGGLANFKSYLAAQYANGTPVVIWYILATPTTETITLPSNLTGIVEGYLNQDSTPSPASPVYPTANGTSKQGGTYSLDTGAYAIAWGRADVFTGTNSISARCYGLPVKSWEIDGNSQQDSGTITIPSQNATVASVESGTNYAMFLKSDFPDVAVGDKVNIVVSGTTHSLDVKKIDAQYVYIENKVV